QTTQEIGVPGFVGHLAAVGRQPHQILDAADAAALKVLSPPKNRLREPKPDEPPDEFEQVVVLVEETPVDPGQLVILAVRVVVPTLAAPELVPMADHRAALREKQRRKGVADLPPQPPVQ